MDLEDVRRAFEAHRMYGIGVQARMEWVDGVPRLHHGAWTEVLDIAWDRWLAATRAALGWMVERTSGYEVSHPGMCAAVDSRAETLNELCEEAKRALAALGGDE